MSVSPWEWLLPADRGAALLSIGEPVEAARAALVERRVERDPARAPFSAIVVFAAPPPDAPGVGGWKSLLAPGGTVLWWDPPPAAPEADPLGPVFRFSVAGRSLWRPEAAWAEALASSGKLDWVRGLARRSASVEHELLWSVPDPDRCRASLAELLDRVMHDGGSALRPSDLARIDQTRTGLVIARFAQARAGKLALKMPADERAKERLEHETRVLEDLAQRELPGEVRNSIPRVIARPAPGELPYRLENWIDGRPGLSTMYRSAEREPAIDAAVDWVAKLHGRGSGVTLDPRERANHARRTLEGVAPRAAAEDGGFARRIADYLEQALARDEIRAVQGHGDFWLGNLVLDRDSAAIAGVIDWTWAEQAAPPLEDVLHLVLYRKGLLSTFAPCARLSRLLAGGGSRSDRQRLARYGRELKLPPRALGALAVVWWVRYLDTRAHYLEHDLREDFRRAYGPVRRTLERLGTDGIEAWGPALFGT